MSAINVQSEMYVVDWQLDFANSEPARSCATDPIMVGPIMLDPGIDDPVNDTGHGPRRGDLQPSEEFTCLLAALVGDGEEFS